MAGRRSSSEHQRRRVVAVALDVFAVAGYAGTSTQQIARAVGFSQPYVVRLFGSKLSLFCEVLDLAWDRTRASIETGLAGAPLGSPSGAGDAPLRILLHGAVVAAVEPEVRSRFLDHVDRTARDFRVVERR